MVFVTPLVREHRRSVVTVFWWRWATLHHLVVTDVCNSTGSAGGGLRFAVLHGILLLLTWYTCLQFLFWACYYRAFFLTSTAY